MKLKEGVDIFTKFDITRIKELVSNFTEEDWSRNTSRQDKFGVHKNTQSIFYTDISFDWIGEGYPLQKFDMDSEVKKELDFFIKELETRFDGKVGKSLFISLKPESMVFPHMDNGPYLEKVRRCHIVIQSNDFVHYFVGKEWIIFEEGDCFELNNQQTHSVVNYSSTPRIHLLIDIIPNEEFK